MFKNLYSIGIISFFVLVFSSNSKAQFSDNFDSYTIPGQVACQNPTDWTTWSNNPCSAEDASVSNVYSYSSPNSALISPNNDFIKLFGPQTSGTWYTSFWMYIPTGKAGYFNHLSEFTFVTGGYWAFDCYFDVGGGGRLTANHNTTNFTYLNDTWNFIQVVVNLDADLAEFWVADSLILSWPWSEGSSSGTGPLELDAADFFGATPNDEMYIDNFWFGNSPVTVEYNDEVVLGFHLEQNYPNPFNPSTNIKFSLKESGNIKLAVYNTLGEQMAVLLNKFTEAGFHELNFDAFNLPSGTYIYKLETPGFIEAKKMLLIK